MVMIRNGEDAYHISLKDEEKLARKKSQRGRGRSQSSGKEIAQDTAQKPKD
jgi:topoisomerase IA-like protein